MRALVLFKFSLREMLILLHPRAVRTVKVNNRSIPDRMALTVMSFIFIYFMTVIVFSFLLMAAGLDFYPPLRQSLPVLLMQGRVWGQLVRRIITPR